MILIVKQAEPAIPELGEHLWGEEYMAARPSKLLETCNVIALTNFAYNPWDALERLGFNLYSIEQFAECVKADDDVFQKGREYFCVIPYALLTSDVTRYDTSKALYEKMAIDVAWNRGMAWSAFLAGKYDEPPQWVRSMMGSGYTACTLPSDGHSAHEYGYVGLDNGDYLLCYACVWYNK